MKRNRILLVELLILAIVSGIFLFRLFGQMRSARGATVASPNQEDTVAVREEILLPTYVKEIPVRAPVALSGAPWQTVFDLRKAAVAQSPFAHENYRPLAEVFGRIVSGKPWYALTLCRGQAHAETQGVSEETRFINNPTALVAVSPSVIFINDMSYDWCLQEDYNTIMQKITYDGVRKEITVTYLNLPLQTQGNVHYELNGLNARDLGYPFVYVDKARSTYELSFPREPNASTDVYEFRNFLHVGSSCKVTGGCNNGSPYQPEVEFDKPKQDAVVPREIYIKLWRERPLSPQQTPDLVERIIILP